MDTLRTMFGLGLGAGEHGVICYANWLSWWLIWFKRKIDELLCQWMKIILLVIWTRYQIVLFNFFQNAIKSDLHKHITSNWVALIIFVIHLLEKIQEKSYFEFLHCMVAACMHGYSLGWISRYRVIYFERIQAKTLTNEPTLQCSFGWLPNRKNINGY